MTWTKRIATAAATLIAVTSAGTPAASPVSPFVPSGTDRPRPDAVRRVAAMPWRLTVSAGATVRVSPAYGPETGQRWADFFASLIHGDELTALNAYIATPKELVNICGDYALGCYGPDRLYISDESIDGVPPVEVAAHEYGHHIAFHRVNSPWSSVDWGTKRWATLMGICSRVVNATAFPGDEDSEYTLNPGEAFAETYRVLNGYGVSDWSVVDASFWPTPAALEAVRADVVDPWREPTKQTIRVRFGKQRVLTQTLATRLDGTLTIHVRGRGIAATLVSTTTGDVVAHGMSMQQQICGERSFALRLTRGRGSASAALEVSRP